MSKILSAYRKAIIDEIVTSISSNVSSYYAVAVNPVDVSEPNPEVANNIYDTQFNVNWTTLFGKKLTSGDIVPVISKSIWTTNTVYTRYDNTVNDLSNFYAISANSIAGGDLYVYKCIDNASGAVSTVDPKTIGTPTQPSTFQTSDNYKWRYIGKISSKNYTDFSTNDFAPIYPDYSIVSTAANYSGVEVVVIANAGSGYATYHTGNVQSTPNTTVIQIEDSASQDDEFYTNNSIYIYNNDSSSSQLFGVSKYDANSSGKFVYLDAVANLTVITSPFTNYLISPKVVFNSDGGSEPKAYATINTTANSINSIVMLDIGSNISWANVVIQSNTSYGSGANLYAIIPPPGGHGSDPSTEIGVSGIGMRFNFANNQGGTIVTSNVVFNKVAIIKNPHTIYANGAKGSTLYTSNLFSSIVKANVSPSFTFTKGSIITGTTSGSKGIVAFSNSTTVFIAGDKTFQAGESLANSSGVVLTAISNLNTNGDVYTKDLNPLYVKNINNLNRLDTQTEAFKLIIEI